MSKSASKLMPPNIVFRIVWPILYISMFIALILFCYHLPRWWISTGFLLFCLQLTVNLLWPYIYFKIKAIPLSFVLIIVLDILVLWTTILFFQQNTMSGSLMIPYLAWLIFATYLNATVLFI